MSKLECGSQNCGPSGNSVAFNHARPNFAVIIQRASPVFHDSTVASGPSGIFSKNLCCPLRRVPLFSSEQAMSVFGFLKKVIGAGTASRLETLATGTAHEDFLQALTTATVYVFQENSNSDQLKPDSVFIFEQGDQLVLSLFTSEITAQTWLGKSGSAEAAKSKLIKTAFKDLLNPDFNNFQFLFNPGNSSSKSISMSDRKVLHCLVNS